MEELGSEVRSLKNLARQLLVIASKLDTEAQKPRIVDPEPQAGSEFGSDEQEPGQGSLARWIYRQRRLRDSVFSDLSLFGEPAWDMLLDLFIAERTGRDLPVTSLCIGSGVAPTTALRWIGVLEHKGLACRENDSADGRRSFIRLSPAGKARMDEYFARIEQFTLDWDDVSETEPRSEA